jgi:ELWxxDGT repeat protein
VAVNSIVAPLRTTGLSREVRLGTLLSAATFLLAFSASAQVPTLVKDIHPGASATATAGPVIDRVLGVSSGRVFMNASVYDAALGLWVTDGTSAGTLRILDVAAGSGADVGGTLFFGVAPPWGVSLWRSDGTAAGTAFASPIGADPFSSGGPTRLTSAGGRLYFLFDDGVHGYEPWTSDGTAAGTKLLKDVTPGPTGTFSGGTTYASLVAVGSFLFFACPPYASPGCGLWRSDGTEAGTLQVADLSFISSAVNANGTLFFAASDGTHGVELWKSDGTVAGTVLVRDLVPGASGSAPSNLVSHGGALYFRLGSDGPIWRSDGTEAGTALVHSQPGSGPLVSSGDRLFSASGSQLWASDGTEAGTTLVRDFGVSFSLSTATTIPGALLLWVDRGVDGLELWRSDGTPAGTTLVKIVEAGNAYASASLSVSIPGTAVLLLSGTPSPLWRSDGTPAGTYPLLQLQFLPNDSHPAYLTDVNGTLLFSAVDADHGQELWRSDGTAAGTVLVKDLEPGPGHSSPSQLLATRSQVFFTARTSAAGFGVYRTDGTEAGTFLVRSLLPGNDWVSLLGLLGELLVFPADDGVHGLEPWRTDGTPEGTFLLGDLTPGPASSTLGAVGALNGSFFLPLRPARRQPSGRRTGLRRERSPSPHPSFSRAGGAGWRSLLLGDRPDARDRAWRRTAQRQDLLLLDVHPAGSSSPLFVGRLGGKLFVWADDGAHGSEPWVTDGTPAGTTLLKDLFPGPVRSGPGAFAIPGSIPNPSPGSSLFVFAHDGVHGFEPWKTDGTPTGTASSATSLRGPPGRTPGAPSPRWGTRRSSPPRITSRDASTGGPTARRRGRRRLRTSSPASAAAFLHGIPPEAACPRFVPAAGSSSRRPTAPPATSSGASPSPRSSTPSPRAASPTPATRPDRRQALPSAAPRPPSSR